MKYNTLDQFTWSFYLVRLECAFYHENDAASGYSIVEDLHALQSNVSFITRVADRTLHLGTMPAKAAKATGAVVAVTTGDSCTDVRRDGSGGVEREQYIREKELSV